MGKFIFLRKEPSPGLRALLFRVIRGETLNSYSTDELRFLHLILCRTYGLCLNFYLLREAVANAGLRDDFVLARKVPSPFWRMLFHACADCGVVPVDFSTEERRNALFYKFNSSPELLAGLTRGILRRCGIGCAVRISERNLIDGNYLYNLGSSLPVRCLMALGFCIRFWGDRRYERWVRLFSGKFFILYLLISGHLGFKPALLIEGASRSYSGLIESILDDFAATKGLYRHEGRTLMGLDDGDSAGAEDADREWLTYLFSFNNSVLFPGSSDDGHRGGQKSQN